jgi:hypothetical protein
MKHGGLWLLGSVLLVSACGRTVSSAATGPGSDVPAPATVSRAANDTVPSEAPAKDPHVDTSTTHVTLKSSSNPTAKVGALTITLLEVIEVAAPVDGKVGRFHRAKLHLEAGGAARDVFLTEEVTALGYTLKLRSAGDGQDGPHAPRESIAVIDVRPSS